MCRPIRCTVCTKITWAGCGQHIDSVKAQVPADQWCDGSHDDAPGRSMGDELSLLEKIFRH